MKRVAYVGGPLDGLMEYIDEPLIGMIMPVVVKSASDVWDCNMTGAVFYENVHGTPRNLARRIRAVAQVRTPPVCRSI